MKISIKLRVFSDRMFVSSHGGRVGVHRGAYGEGWGGQQCGGGNNVVAGGGGNCWGGGGGGQQWGCLQPLRTVLHTISLSLQNIVS